MRPGFGSGWPKAADATPTLQPTRAHPLLYQVNTRILLTSLSHELGRQATLDEVADSALDRIAEDGFDWVWLLGVWQTGAAGRQASLGDPELRREYREVLPDFSDLDVSGSCFAIHSYSVHSDFGGNVALKRFRRRIHDRGMRLMLDFVPNHVAPDHSWVRYHPEYFVRGTEAQIEREPHNYVRVDTLEGRVVMAHARDPYSAAWPDTLQLNYANAEVREAMASELVNIAAMCDGVRCDMAMLILPEVFERTWSVRPEPFWPEAITRTRARQPGFVMMADASWKLERALQQQGFDYTYDKHLYDRLREGHACSVREHFRADLDYQQRLARFLENHAEQRAAAAFPPEMHQSAAIVAFLCAGLRFIHQGQLQGFSKRIPVGLNRGPVEPGDPELEEFYSRLLRCLRHPCAQGDWRLLECKEASAENATWDSYIGFAWSAADQPSLIVAVNYAAMQSQGYLQIPADLLTGNTMQFRDLMGSETYERNGEELRARGLYLDLPPWGYRVFEMTSEMQCE